MKSDTVEDMRILPYYCSIIQQKYVQPKQGERQNGGGAYNEEERNIIWVNYGNDEH